MAVVQAMRTGRFAAKTGEKHIPVFTLKSERFFIKPNGFSEKPNKTLFDYDSDYDSWYSSDTDWDSDW